MNRYIITMLSMACIMSLQAQEISKEAALATGGVAAIPQDIITQPELPKVPSEPVSAMAPKLEPVVEPIAEPVMKPAVEPVAEPKVEPLVTPKVESIAMPKLEPVVTPVKPVQKTLVQDVKEVKAEPDLEMMPVAKATMEKEAAEDACAVKNISGDADAMIACVEESAKEIDKKAEKMPEGMK